MKNITEIFCDVDDFCQVFIPVWEQGLLSDGQRKRQRAVRMTMSEVMTIIIGFHTSHHRDFKNYYLGFVHRYLRDEFPSLLSYTRFLEVMPGALLPLCAYFTSIKGQPTGLEFIDSSSLKVCHNIRIPRHKTFEGIAQGGKTCMGCFYGFKLHLIVNFKGEVVAAKVPPGNVDDRKPVAELASELEGKLYGDKGYLGQALQSQLFDQGISLITTVRKNMKAKVIAAWDKAMFARCFIIESINDQLKNITQIEHSRHRSPHGFMLKLIGALIAYSLKKQGFVNLI